MKNFLSDPSNEEYLKILKYFKMHFFIKTKDIDFLKKEIMLYEDKRLSGFSSSAIISDNIILVNFEKLKDVIKHCTFEFYSLNLKKNPFGDTETIVSFFQDLYNKNVKDQLILSDDEIKNLLKIKGFDSEYQHLENFNFTLYNQKLIELKEFEQNSIRHFLIDNLHRENFNDLFSTYIAQSVSGLNLEMTGVLLNQFVLSLKNLKSEGIVVNQKQILEDIALDIFIKHKEDKNNILPSEDFKNVLINAVSGYLNVSVRNTFFRQFNTEEDIQKLKMKVKV